MTRLSIHKCTNSLISVVFSCFAMRDSFLARPGDWGAGRPLADFKSMTMNLKWMALLLNGTISLPLFQYEDSRQNTQTYDSCQTIGSIIESWCWYYYNHWFVPVVVAFVKAHRFAAESHSTLEWMNSVHQGWRVIIYSRLLNFAHLTELLQTSRWISKEVRRCSTFLFYSDKL